MASNHNIKQDIEFNFLEKEDGRDSVINEIPSEYFELARIFALVVVENYFENINNQFKET